MESLSLSGKSARRQSDASGRGERPEGNENDTSELDKEEGNILGSIISQCEPCQLVRVIQQADVVQYGLGWI